MTPITELTLETAPRALWYEWLTGFFDGQAHAVGDNAPVTFPLVSVQFDQSPLATQPLLDASAPVELRVTMAPIRENACAYPGGRLATSQVVHNFWIRAGYADVALSRRRALEVGQLLHAILANPDARLPLGRNGITRLAPRTPALVSDVRWVVYLLACKGDLSYLIAF